MKMLRLLVCLLLVQLFGCSSDSGSSDAGGEPSSSDIEKVLKATVDQENQRMKEASGDEDMGSKVLHEVRKVGCAEAQGFSGYNCDVEIDLETSAIAFGLGESREKKVVQMRFVKGDEGWHIIQ